MPRTAAGVEVVDDWDGFGQALTASGTAHFEDVAIDPEWTNTNGHRFAYAAPFYQLVHIASLAGIGRALADDLGTRVRERDRVYSHGNAARVADDPQILQVVGRVRSAAYAAGAIALHAAGALQRADKALRDSSAHEESRAAAIRAAHVEVDQAVSVVTGLVLNASTELFDALGASATLRTHGLDRYWRNARTISSHNPRVYRERQAGAFAVNGTTPPASYRIGKASSSSMPQTSARPDSTRTARLAFALMLAP
ncbi:Acyl-CoA dehydrogenase, C-terminal domain [Variovorax sp. YR216]|nr:Acyl-CoA dehydrogenase, C-terminal domain [Variovorax sp. YR216]